MALQLEMEIKDSGITANYIKVEDISYTKQSDDLVIILGVYKDKAAREMGKQPIDMISVQVTNAGATSLSGENFLTMIYNLLKSQSPFDGAIDV